MSDRSKALTFCLQTSINKNLFYSRFTHTEYFICCMLTYVSLFGSRFSHQSHDLTFFEIVKESAAEK